MLNCSFYYITATHCSAIIFSRHMFMEVPNFQKHKMFYFEISTTYRTFNPFLLILFSDSQINNC